MLERLEGNASLGRFVEMPIGSAGEKYNIAGILPRAAINSLEASLVV
jgi:hypothetical protein